MRFFSGRSRGKSRSCGPGGGRRHAPGCLRCVGGGPVEKWWCRYTQPTVAHRVACRYRDVQPNVAESEDDHGVRKHRARDPRRRLTRGRLRGHQQPGAPAGVVAGRGRPRAGARRRRRARLRRPDRRAEAHVVPITVVDADPPRLFSFRWVYPDGESADSGNSLLVTFELDAVGHGHRRCGMTETGFREMGWEVAVLEEQYHDHVAGLGPLPPPPRRVRRPAGRRRHDASTSTTTSGRRSGTRPGAGCSTCSWPTATARPPAQRAAAGDPPGGRQAPRRARPRRPGPRHAGRAGEALPGRRGPARPRGRPAVRGRRDLGRPAAAHQADRRGDPARAASRTSSDPRRPATSQRQRRRNEHGGHPAQGRRRSRRRRTRSTRP